MSEVIEVINAAGRAFVDFAVPMLIQSSVLVVILLLVEAVLRKRVRAVFRYWIWMLVLVKLVLPPSLWSPVSVGTWFGDTLEVSTAELFEPARPQAVELRSVAVDILSQSVPTFTELRALAEEPAVTEQAVPARTAIGREGAHRAAESGPSVADLPAAPAVSPGPALSGQGVTLLAWAAVAMALLLLLLQRAFFVCGLVAQADMASPAMLRTLERCRARMGVSGNVGLRISPNASSPAVCGLFRPVILIPSHLSPTLQPSDVEAVLLHELAHVRRGDLWINLAQTLLQIVYFYNPLLWLANAMIRRIREQAIDEAVLVAMGETARQYPETLVSVARLAFRRPALSLRLIGVVESKSALRSRIKHILNRPIPKTARLGIVGLLVIVATAAVLLPMAKADGDDSGVGQSVRPDATEDEWGREVGQVQCRLRADRLVWQEGQIPTLKADIRNNGSQQLRVAPRHERCDLILDGRTYHWPTWEYVELRGFSPGSVYRDILIPIVETWAGGSSLQLHPGLHKVSVVFQCQGTNSQGETFVINVESNPVEIEIAAKETMDIEVVEASSKHPARLPDGITVELVGLCRQPRIGARWWDPEGADIPEPRYRAEKHVGTAREEYECSILARITGGNDASAIFKIPSGYLGGSGRLGPTGFVLCGLSKFPPEPIQDSERIDVEVGIAQGEWIDTRTEIQNGAHADPVTIRLRDDDTVVVDPLSSNRHVTGGRKATVLSGIPSSADYQFRAEFTTTDGQVVQDWGRTPVRARSGEPDRFLLILEDVWPKEIASFRLFYRKFAFARFTNVCLRPVVPAPDPIGGNRSVAAAIEREFSREPGAGLPSPPVFGHDVKLNFADPTVRDGSFHSEQSVAFVMSFHGIGDLKPGVLLSGVLIGQTNRSFILEDDRITIQDGSVGREIASETWPAEQRQFDKVITLPVTYGQKRYSCPVHVEMDRHEQGSLTGSYWFCAYLSGRLPWGAGGRSFEIVNLDQQMEFRLVGDGTNKEDAVLGIDIDGDGKIDPSETGGERLTLYEPFRIGSSTYRVTEVDPYLPRVVFREVGPAPTLASVPQAAEPGGDPQEPTEVALPDADVQAATLANGVTVRFLAYSQLTLEGLKWWTPQGKPTTIPDIYEADVEGRGTVLVFRIQPAVDTLYTWSYQPPSKRNRLEDTWRLNNGDIWLVALGEEDAYANIDMQAVVADPLLIRPVLLKKEGSDGRIAVGRYGIRAISDLRTVDSDSVRFSVQRDLPGPRVVAAVDHLGRLHPLRVSSAPVSAYDEVAGLTASYEVDLRMGQFFGVVVEGYSERGARVTFRNVSVTPSRQAQMRVEVASEQRGPWWRESPHYANIERLGKRLARYAEAHADRYPAKLSALKDSTSETDWRWLEQHIAYLAAGRSSTQEAGAPLAYDKTLLPLGYGTYVLGSDGRIDFEIPSRLRELDIPANGGSGTPAAPDARHSMLQLGLAVALYANEHNGALPAALVALEPYSEPQMFAWLQEHVAYMAKGNVKDYAAPHATVTAYEKAPQPAAERYVLFLDGHVALVGPEQLKELGLERAGQAGGEAQPQPIAGAPVVNEATVTLGGDTPLGLFYNEHSLWFELYNRSADALEINREPLDQDENERGEWGYVDVLTEDGEPVTYTWRSRPDMCTVPPGTRYKVHIMNGRPLRKSGPGVYKARLTLRVRNARTDETFLVQSNWHTFRVTPAGRLPGEAEGSYEELQEAEALAATCDFGHGSREDAIQRLLALTQTYADTKYALAAYFGAARQADALANETGDEAHRAKRREYFREIVKRWPDVVNHHTIYARLHTHWGLSPSEFVQSRKDTYQWLLSLTEEQKIASILGYAILSGGDPTDDDVARMLRSLNEYIGLTKKMLEGSVAGVGTSSEAARRSDEALQRLIREAPPGSTVIIPRGRYTTPIEVTKPLVLRGESQEGCVIEVTADAPAVLIETKERARGVTLENVTIRWQLATSGRTQRPFALMVKDSLALVRNCRFEPLGDYRRCPVAVRIDGASEATLDNCRFRGFEFTVCYGPGTEGTVRDCILTDPGHQGLTNYAGAEMTVQRCIVTGAKFHAVRCTGGTLNVRDSLLINNANRGIYLGNKSGRGIIMNNLILGNDTGISGFARATYAIANNVIISNSYAGIDMRDSCMLDIHSNVLVKNQRGVMLHKEGQRNYNTMGGNTCWANTTDIENFDEAVDPLRADPQFADPNAGNFAVQGPARGRGHGLSDPEIIRQLWKKYERVGREPPLEAEAPPVVPPSAPAQASASLAWQRTDRYVPPDPQGFFPDDVEGGKRLDALFKAVDKDRRGDEEILSTVRQGLRRTKDYRSSILRWVGNRYIWGKDPQNAEAIEIMYHAVPMERHYAIYFGLSVTKDKTPNILRTLAEICMQGEDVGRITWGLGPRRRELIAYIEPYLQDADPDRREIASVLVQHFEGKLDFEKWKEEKRLEGAKVEFADQLPQFKQTLLTGDSSARREVFATIQRERLAALLDDSFIPAFQACGADPDRKVRNEVARMAGGRWVWGAQEQDPRAIALMLELASDDVRDVRSDAVYYGLSVVRDKTEPVIRRLVELALSDHENNLYGRIVWGLKGSMRAAPEPFEEVLAEYLDRSTSNTHLAASVYLLYRDVLQKEPPDEWNLARIKQQYREDLFTVVFSAKEPFAPQSADALWSAFAQTLAEKAAVERMPSFRRGKPFVCVAQVRSKQQADIVRKSIEDNPRLSFGQVQPVPLWRLLYEEEKRGISSFPYTDETVAALTGPSDAAPGPIQQRIDAAAPGETIRLEPGLYKESLIINKPLVLEGAGWDETIIMKEKMVVQSFEDIQRVMLQRLSKAGSDAQREEMAAQMKKELVEKLSPTALRVEGTQGVVVRGIKFTSPGGHIKGTSINLPIVAVDGSGVRFEDCAVIGGPGHGIHVLNGSDVEIDATLVAAVWGTGIAVASGTAPSRAHIHDSDIRNCHYAGIRLGRDGAEMTVERSRISGAAWHGIRYDDASPTIVNNLIFGNARSGIYASGQTRATVRGNLFYANEMTGMSCWFQNTDAIAGNTFADNKEGGLAILGASNPTIQSNIFCGSPAGISLGNIGSDSRHATSDGTVTLRENLFWANEQDMQWRRDADTTGTITLDEETGTVRIDPSFVAPTARDFSLRADSPARQSGIGVADPIPFESPWPLQPEEKAIIPQGETRDYRQWRHAS